MHKIEAPGGILTLDLSVSEAQDLADTSIDRNVLTKRNIYCVKLCF